MGNEQAQSNYPRPADDGNAGSLSAYVAVGGILLIIFVSVFSVVGILTVVDPRSDLMKLSLGIRMVLSGVLQVGMGIAAAGWMGSALRITSERLRVQLAVPPAVVAIGVFLSPLLAFVPAFFGFDFLLRRNGLPRGIGFAFLVTGIAGVVTSLLSLSVYAGRPDTALLMLISGTLTQIALILGWLIGLRVTRALQAS